MKYTQPHLDNGRDLGVDHTGLFNGSLPFPADFDLYTPQQLMADPRPSPWPATVPACWSARELAVSEESASDLPVGLRSSLQSDYY